VVIGLGVAPEVEVCIRLWPKFADICVALLYRPIDSFARIRDSIGPLDSTGEIMWTHEDSSETSASPAGVWKLFSNVASWKDWNAGIESIEIHGPFEKGTSFTMTPPGQDAMTSTLIEVTPNEVFTDETVVDETRVLVSHRLVPLPSGGTRIIYSTEITGPGADEFGPMVTADFPDVLAALKRLAEQQ
jgi:hypothetical protein